jgi:pimeloyl-ACP methyl ester carboxylesterase
MPSARARRRTLGQVTANTPSTEHPYPGAEHPARQYTVDSNGLGIAVHEWGDEAASPLVLVHGGFDFGRTYDVFAPKLAAGGWRVVSWDQRGHGDSEHPELYSWDADMRDALAVFDHVSPGRPMPVIGHSKGGALMTQLADAQPFRFTHLVNMDGIPYNRRIPDVAEHERTKMVATEIAGWLEHRRSTATAQRKPGTIDELAARRGRMNPRLDVDWLRRLVTVGGYESADGWRWKIDPSMRFGGFGPWRPEWTLMRLPGLPMPFLGILGREMEEMGWGTPPEKVLPYLPSDGRCEILDDVGHFVHIEQPDLVSSMVLDFIGAPA